MIPRAYNPHARELPMLPAPRRTDVVVECAQDLPARFNELVPVTRRPLEPVAQEDGELCCWTGACGDEDLALKLKAVAATAEPAWPVPPR